MAIQVRQHPHPPTAGDPGQHGEVLPAGHPDRGDRLGHRREQQAGQQDRLDHRDRHRGGDHPDHSGDQVDSVVHDERRLGHPSVPGPVHLLGEAGVVERGEVDRRGGLEEA
ncbi:hypothetical protein ACVCAH_30080 [Micromonospora sp. LZ34]